MSAAAFGLTAIICYSLAAVCVAIAVILFFVLHIRDVCDDLTGRTAQRAIAQLRSGSSNRSKFFGGEERGAAAKNAGKRRSSLQKDSSGSLKLRHFSNEDNIPTAHMDEDAAATTMLGAQADEADAMPTTMLGAADGTVEAPCSEDDMATTMLSASGADPEDSLSTTMLSAPGGKGGAR